MKKRTPLLVRMGVVWLFLSSHRTQSPLKNLGAPLNQKYFNTGSRKDSDVSLLERLSHTTSSSISMFLIFVAIDAHPKYRLAIAANRDEFYDRPTAPAFFWPEAPELLAGRDRRAGGTFKKIRRTLIARVQSWAKILTLHQLYPSSATTSGINHVSVQQE